MNTENIKKFILIEAVKLATDNVNILCWEAEDASKILETYESRKKWNDETAELYDTTVHFQFRKVILWPSSKAVDTYQIGIEDVIKISKN
jgi:hypothetical protein